MRLRTIQLLKCNKRLLLFFSWERLSIYFSYFFKCFTLCSGLFVVFFIIIIRNWLKLENKKADCGHHNVWWKTWWNQIKISSIGRFFENTSSEAHITSIHYYTVFLRYISFCFKQTISLKWDTSNRPTESNRWHLDNPLKISEISHAFFPYTCFK